MIIECLSEVRVPYKGYDYLFEERDIYGYVYEVDEKLGKEAIATGECQEIVVDDEHPYTGPKPETPPRSVIGELPIPEPTPSPRRRGSTT